jgi:hypothetical protein
MYFGALVGEYYFIDKYEVAVESRDASPNPVQKLDIKTLK